MGTYAPGVGQADDDGAVEAARALLREAAETLAEASAPQEALAEFEPAHRRFGIARKARMRPIGRVWRLGVVLLEPGGSVRATGGITRAVPPGHPRHAALSIEARREVRAAAHRGPFAEGETIDYDTSLIELEAAALRSATGPLFLRDGRVLVRWSVSAGDDAARDLAPYTAERVDLLLRPPQGAT